MYGDEILDIILGPMFDYKTIRQIMDEHGYGIVRSHQPDRPPSFEEGNTDIPLEAYEILRDILLVGASKGHSGWQNVPIEEHIKALEEHLNKYKRTGGPSSAHHLSHVFCRAMMAAVIKVREDSNFKGGK